MDMKIARAKWRTHYKHCGRRGVLPLTFELYVKKLLEANIEPHQVGRTLGSYQLGRFTDSGDYTESSCRFITQTQNLLERSQNGGCERGASKNRGKTAKDTEWLAKRAEAFRGRTAETHEHIARMANSKAKPFHFIHESGAVIKGRNIRKYCRDNGLEGQRPGFGRLMRGQIESYRGWKLGKEAA